MKIDGRFWLTKEDKNFLGSGRVELLKTIEKTGSIHSAAKEMKMSYKAAWERLNDMNNLADEPLLIKTTGGKSGGGSVLTPYAHKLIDTFDRLQEVHRLFIDRFAEAGDDAEHLARVLSRTFLTTSARNQLLSHIDNITFEGVNATIELSLEGGISLRSSITTKSIKSMGLREHSKVYAIIKSSDVEIVAHKPAKLSQNINIIEGVISSLEVSQNCAEVSLSVNKNLTLVAMMDVKDVAILKADDRAYALIDKNHIIIGM